jgi:SAM-dependent methyltransferase
MLANTHHYGYSMWNFHLRSLLQWGRHVEIASEIHRLLHYGLVLDVGCGFGHITEMLCMKGIRAVGLDIVGRGGVWRDLSASFLVGDACNTPFHSNTFDAIVCCGVLEHVRNPRAFLQECGRALKRDGLFLCYYLPNKTGLESLFSKTFPTEHRFYDKNSIMRLFIGCGFKVKTLSRAHVLPQPRSNQAIQVWNDLNKVLRPLDRFLARTPLGFLRDNWRVHAEKKQDSNNAVCSGKDDMGRDLRRNHTGVHCISIPSHPYLQTPGPCDQVQLE